MLPLTDCNGSYCKSSYLSMDHLMIVLGSIWLPIFDADLGWCRPINMGPEKISSMKFLDQVVPYIWDQQNAIYEGKIYIIQTPINDGSLLLVTRLETSDMKLLYEF
ncbi:shikimate/quinate hydroxycinnamoyl transferase [Gossypium australe]|uniref:Shikimate/quinate hydroxycinnamoyl transferase n=1 Tax=Gossypium australe TaxID=47621 RepID=A0A5B6WFE6_9ROSI|nr:shikimate/quinate hydroxycinnamoyl transferase [Gossypium australe]